MCWSLFLWSSLLLSDVCGWPEKGWLLPEMSWSWLQRWWEKTRSLIQLFSSKPWAVTLFFLSSLIAPGYRSPLRPIPWEIIPDKLPHEGVHNLEFNNDEDIANSSTPDSWWLEFAKVADKVEKKQDFSQLNMMVSKNSTLPCPIWHCFLVVEAEMPKKTSFFVSFAAALTFLKVMSCCAFSVQNQTGRSRRRRWELVACCRKNCFPDWTLQVTSLRSYTVATRTRMRSTKVQIILSIVP